MFRQHENSLLEPLLDFLGTRDDVRIVGPGSMDHRAPIVSILPLGKPVEEVYHALINHRLMLGSGDFYAVRPLKDMKIPADPGVIRMSFLHYTNEAEIDQLIGGLKAVL